jgi:Arc/MetJ family transcription regulator
MPETGILMHIRTTIVIDKDLLTRAEELTGIHEKTALVRAGLEALIAREAGKRLAALGGTMPQLQPIPRRRSRVS